MIIITIKYILLLYMPTVPLYNQGATEEAGLTRAKRRVVKALKSGIAKLTEKPDTDPTNGSADQLANLLIAQYEDLTALSRQVTAYMGDGTKDVEMDPEGAIKALKLAILMSKVVSRVLRLSGALASVMRFLDLGILSDLKAVKDECTTAFYDALRGLRSLDLKSFSPQQMKAIADFQDPELGTVLSEWDEEDDDLSTVGSISIGTVGSTTLGTKRSGSTSSKGSKSGSTKSKGTFASAPVRGADTRPRGRLGTMFQYMFGATEDLARPMGTSLDRLPEGKGKGKGKPRPRGIGRFVGQRVPTQEAIRVPTQEDVDEDMTLAVNRGQRMAELEEEEFQALARDDGSLSLEPEEYENEEQRDTDSLIDRTINSVQQIRVPFTQFGAKAYEDLVDLIQERYVKSAEILYAGFQNFNAYRKQRIFPAKAPDADVSNAIKTGAGFYDVQGTASRFYGVTPHIQKIYSVGGSSNLLYEREGLPRFL